MSTAYRLFGSKEGLLLAVWQQRFAQVGADVYRPEFFRLPVREAVPRFVRALIDHALEPGALRMFRLIVAEGALFPELRERIFPIVQQRIIKPLETYLRGEVERRNLRLEDPQYAAGRVGHLVRAEAFWCLLRGIDHPVKAADKTRMVNEVVEIFWSILAAQPHTQSEAASAPRRQPA